MPYKMQHLSYRNINGVYYQQWSDNESEFPQLIEEIKKEGAAYRVIKIIDKIGPELRLFKEYTERDKVSAMIRRLGADHNSEYCDCPFCLFRSEWYKFIATGERAKPESKT